MAKVICNVLQAINLANKQDCYFRANNDSDFVYAVENGEVHTYDISDGEFDTEEPTNSHDIGSFIENEWDDPLEEDCTLCSVEVQNKVKVEDL